MNRTTTSVPLTLARIGAVAMSILVVGYLIWRAQSNSQPNQPENPPAGASQPDQAAGGESNVLDLPENMLSTSKAFSPDLPLLPSSKDPGPDTLMPSSKFAPLPSSKSIVIEEITEDEALLFSSKSGRPIVPKPTAKPGEKPKTDKKPKQKKPKPKDN